VPLTGENRIIVRHGLEGLCVVKNLGLRALLKVAGLKEGAIPTAGQVAFQIAPRINAAGRMATATEVIELLLTTDGERARSLAEQLDALNADRQRTEAQIVTSILEECSRVPVNQSQAALVFAGEGWHRGRARNRGGPSGRALPSTRVCAGAIPPTMVSRRAPGAASQPSICWRR